MRFRTLTGAQRHRLTNMLFFAGVVSAIGTVTGTSILGCPAVSRESRLDNEDPDVAVNTATSPLPPPGLKEKQFVGGKMEPVRTNRGE
ncbi:hypothetical protein LPJ66_002615 [Kickxella alabastrina]|uniref:Uncharacterized protein n=1 Tax=Kickxella alabastrina TaxID=61397 RepID=A0ACC1IPY0_9FUNG|nr:hypothetical protein LPJ66_002615 [Kickxella alabastrina]